MDLRDHHHRENLHEHFLYLVDYYHQDLYTDQVEVEERKAFDETYGIFPSDHIGQT